MEYEQAYRYLIPRLEQELPVHLTYHNAQHTKEVLQAARDLCKAENVNEHQQELLLTAVLFHDAGFIKSHIDHEEVSCKMATEALPNFGYSHKEIEVICDLIMATRLPHKPATLLQNIICDADLHYLGTSHYFTLADKLYHEYKHQGLVRDREDWHKKQITFLEEHKFYTRSAIKEFGSIKKQNLQLLSAGRKPAKENDHTVVHAISDWTLILLGTIAAGFGLNGFLVPNHFFDGGISGIALLVKGLYDFDLSLLIILLNLPIVIISYFGTGKSFAIKMTVAILLLAVCLHFIPEHAATKDKLLVAVFGGFFIGLGSGLAIR
jgi:predicted metal-dependent HD superfamily phosphohydrolase